MKALVWRLAFALLMISPAIAASPSEQRGKTFALANCARCHSIDRVTQSPLRIAPPFRTLHLRYPVESLGEALAEGIETGHPTMPAFQLDPDQIHDLLSYLKSLNNPAVQRQGPEGMAPTTNPGYVSWMVILRHMIAGLPAFALSIGTGRSRSFRAPRWLSRASPFWYRPSVCDPCRRRITRRCITSNLQNRP